MMMSLSLFILSAMLILAIKADEVIPESGDTREIVRTDDNGVVGVASFTGITSRNGRVSSLGGVRFYPSSAPFNAGSGDTGEFFYPLQPNQFIQTRNQGHLPYFYSGSRSTLPFPNAEQHALGRNFAGNRLHNGFFQPQLEQLDIPNKNWYQKEVQNQVYLNELPQGIRANTWGYPNFNPFMNFW